MRHTIKIATLFSFMVMMATTAQAELVGHWTFDEASSGTGTGIAADSSGNGHDGVIAGDAVYTVGQVGTGALVFDGTDDHVEVPYSADLGFANSDYTIALWIKTEGGFVGDHRQKIINKDDNNDYNGGYDIHTYNYGDGWNRLLNMTHTDGTIDELLGPTLPITEWQHATFTYSVATGVHSLYIDGVFNRSRISHPLTDDGNDPLWFGGLAGYSSLHYRGVLDDIQMYNQALTAEEVMIVKDGGIIQVPEPSTFVMLIVGLLGLLGCNFRRAKRNQI